MTVGPGLEKLKFAWDSSDIEEKEVCSNHGPWGLAGATLAVFSIPW